MAVMRRVSIVGNAGSGKSSLAAAISARLGVQHIELDAIFHQPDWTELPTDTFRQRVVEALAGDDWVVDGNYSVVRDLIWQRADTVLWLDFPRRVVMRRIIQRTLSRVIWRRELWNGNHERWTSMFTLDPGKSIIAWAWTNHEKYHDRYAAAAADPPFKTLQFVHLQSPSQVAAFLASIG